jgi:hypothetical protein
MESLRHRPSRMAQAVVGGAARCRYSTVSLAASVKPAIVDVRAFGAAMAPGTTSPANQGSTILAEDAPCRARRVFLATPRQETALTMLEKPGLTDD